MKTHTQKNNRLIKGRREEKKEERVREEEIKG